MYPIKFKPIIKNMIWGSESWDITCRTNEMSVIENGEYSGMTFADFIAKDPNAVLGTCIRGDFPLLVKIIHANDALSVQVHPDDEYARLQNEADMGKSELWYVLNPPTDGQLIVGLKKGVTREKLANAYNNGVIEECLNRVNVFKGDIISIPTGLIHALTPGTSVVEIHQNSDITYRLYDFDRLGADGQPRALHVDNALDVINYSDDNKPITHCTAKIKTISTEIFAKSNPKAFTIYTCIDKDAIFETNFCTLTIEKTRSVFIPAMLGDYTIRPKNGENVTLLKSSPKW